MNEPKNTKKNIAFYSLPSIDFTNIQTLDELLNHIFPLILNKNETPKTNVDETFLLHFA